MLIEAVSSEIPQHSFLILSNYLFPHHPPLCYKWYTQYLLPGQLFFCVPYVILFTFLDHDQKAAYLS